MNLETVSTHRAPSAIGPYSQAVRAGGMVYCSGQIALDPASGEMVGQTAADQAEQVLKNLQAVLEDGGSGLSLVVKTTIYLSDLGDFAPVNEVYGRFFGSHRPARATVEVSRLPRGALVEIEAVGLAAGS